MMNALSMNQTGADLPSRWHGATHRGRRKNNEDVILTLPLDGGCLLAVADGMGGRPAGEVAAEIAIETLRRGVLSGYREGMQPGGIRGLLRDAFRNAHYAVLAEAAGPRLGMATTLVAALVAGDGLIIANSGDSRAHLIGEAGILRTKDHSEVQRLVDAGIIDEAAAARHPRRNIVLHAIGHDPVIDLYETALAPGDVVVLSSDGLHDFVDAEIFAAAASLPDARAIAGSLMDAAFLSSDDNISVVAYRHG